MCARALREELMLGDGEPARRLCKRLVSDNYHGALAMAAAQPDGSSWRAAVKSELVKLARLDLEPKRQQVTAMCRANPDVKP
jgi:hypothetical protein